MSEKSLQININNLADARSVLQNLQSVKQAFDAHGCVSVQFVIEERHVTEAARIMVGAIPWCTTYRTVVTSKPKDSNYLFPLPEYRPPSGPPPVLTPKSSTSPDSLVTQAAISVPLLRGPNGIPERPPKRRPSASPEPPVQAHADNT